MSKHFNGLSADEAERLAMLSEECAEVIQVIGKILRHGYDSSNPNTASHGVFNPSNYTLLVKELNDIGAVVYGMTMARDFTEDEFTLDHQAEIWKKKLRWTHHQVQVDWRDTSLKTDEGYNG